MICHSYNVVQCGCSRDLPANSNISSRMVYSGKCREAISSPLHRRFYLPFSVLYILIILICQFHFLYLNKIITFFVNFLFQFSYIYHFIMDTIECNINIIKIIVFDMYIHLESKIFIIKNILIKKWFLLMMMIY